MRTIDSPAKHARNTSGMTEQLLAAEHEMLLHSRTDTGSPYFPGAASKPLGRRSFMLSSIAAAGVTVGLASNKSYAASLGSVQREVPADPSKVQGTPLADESYGLRSQFETEVRVRVKTSTPQSSWTLTPLEKGCGIITPCCSKQVTGRYVVGVDRTGSRTMTRAQSEYASAAHRPLTSVGAALPRRSTAYVTTRIEPPQQQVVIKHSPLWAERSENLVEINWDGPCDQIASTVRVD